jgi:hypothetical protein
MPALIKFLGYSPIPKSGAPALMSEIKPPFVAGWARSVQNQAVKKPPIADHIGG